MHKQFQRLSFVVFIFVLSYMPIVGMEKGKKQPTAVVKSKLTSTKQEKALSALPNSQEECSEIQQDFSQDDSQVNALDEPKEDQPKKEVASAKVKEVAIKKGQPKAPNFPQAHFAPHILDVFLKLVSDENTGVNGACCWFTLYPAAKAIVEKKIACQLIVNDDFNKHLCDAIKLLLQNKKEVFKKNKPMKRVSSNLGKFEQMHHKFFIFNDNVQHKKLLWTGSFNFTGQANNKNSENVIILDDEEAIEKFTKEFEQVLTYSDKITITECNQSTASTHPWSLKMNGIPDNN